MPCDQCPSLLLHALPTRHTVSPQTTCQVNLAPLSCSLSGLQSAMRLVANTGVHCIQHGSCPLDINLSETLRSWLLFSPVAFIPSSEFPEQKKKNGGFSLTHLQRFSPESTALTGVYCLSRAVFLTLTLPSWEEGWHLLSVAGR